ncbi:MAG: class I SAM-dependent methyltransferase [bacterium]
MSIDAWETYWQDRQKRDWWKQPAPEVVDLISSLSPLERPRVLDLGCGLGRHAVAFALARFSVTAVDASPTAIRHLNQWARSMGLSIGTQVCEVLAETLPSEAFDVVLSYNVIYHGSREEFAQAIQHVRRLLKRDGVFFFTCPSRRDGKYGFGEKVAPHTYRCTRSITPGDIHYFADEEDLAQLLVGFRMLSCWTSEGYWDNQGAQQFYSNWHVRAEKA